MYLSLPVVLFQLNLSSLLSLLTSSSYSEFWWEARRLPIERWNDSTWPSSNFALGYDVSVFVDTSQLRNVSSQAYKNYLFQETNRN